jgi:ATP-dependent DNA helicase DinG
VNIADYFVLDVPRPRQLKALDFIQKKISEGYKDIVIPAPTGSGKSAIGLTTARWYSQSFESSSNTVGRGAYYLVTQKLLQDQLEKDNPLYQNGCHTVLLKGADEYTCQFHGTCGVAARKKDGCSCKKSGTCPYTMKKDEFVNAEIGITNYSYYLNERKYAGKLADRQVLIADECHGIENEIMRFIEISVSEEDCKRWTGDSLPVLRDLKGYLEWLVVYRGVLSEHFNVLTDLTDASDDQNSDLRWIDGMVCSINRTLEYVSDDIKNWVFWEERDDNDRISSYRLKPIVASNYFMDLFGGSDIRVYLSAYPGDKHTFCKSLGLNPDDVAWGALGSDFPIENRPIYFKPMGSMSKRDRDQTIPVLIRAAKKIAASHKERGLIHCVSYDIGQRICRELQDLGREIIFPKKADEREAAMQTFAATDGSIFISPSVTEGFDFKDDLARWQIIAKVAYPYIGDRQVKARMDIDPDWYQMKAVMMIVQSSGRVVRSMDDWGITYILDSDFGRLYEKQNWMFPKWFKDAVVKR